MARLNFDSPANSVERKEEMHVVSVCFSGLLKEDMSKHLQEMQVLATSVNLGVCEFVLQRFCIGRKVCEPDMVIGSLIHFCMLNCVGVNSQHRN